LTLAEFEQMRRLLKQIAVKFQAEFPSQTVPLKKVLTEVKADV
jgi:hypothetical protein